MPRSPRFLPTRISKTRSKRVRTEPEDSTRPISLLSMTSLHAPVPAVSSPTDSGTSDCNDFAVKGSKSPEWGPLKCSQAHEARAQGQSNPKRSWQCVYPDCEAIFTRREHLTRHTNCKHNHLKNFVCGICPNRKFGRRDELNRHLRLHVKKGHISSQKIPELMPPAIVRRSYTYYRDGNTDEPGSDKADAGNFIKQDVQESQESDMVDSPVSTTSRADVNESFTDIKDFILEPPSTASPLQTDTNLNESLVTPISPLTINYGSLDVLMPIQFKQETDPTISPTYSSDFTPISHHTNFLSFTNEVSPSLLSRDDLNILESLLNNYTEPPRLIISPPTIPSSPANSRFPALSQYPHLQQLSNLYPLPSQKFKPPPQYQQIQPFQHLLHQQLPYYPVYAPRTAPEVFMNAFQPDSADHISVETCFIFPLLGASDLPSPTQFTDRHGSDVFFGAGELYI